MRAALAGLLEVLLAGERAREVVAASGAVGLPSEAASA